MNYHSRFGMEFNPFIKNTNNILVETEEYREVIVRLNYLLNNKGFGLITGSAGKGKTTAIRNWVKTLNQSLYKVVYIPITTITCVEFYRYLANELGLESHYKKYQNFTAIQKEINRLVMEKRITPVIILDEANHINSNILNDLKILFNFEMDSRDRAVVILTGLPALNNTLRVNSQEPLRQRITMNYNLEGLTKEEASIYIKEKIRKANGIESVFTPNAIEGIINAANGTPRIIDKICNSCMIIADNKKMETINQDIVMMAVNETELA